MMLGWPGTVAAIGASLVAAALLAVRVRTMTPARAG
jgi:hypothetical protein